MVSTNPVRRTHVAVPLVRVNVDVVFGAAASWSGVIGVSACCR